MEMLYGTVHGTHVRQRLFIVQSRFDEFQLMNAWDCRVLPDRHMFRHLVPSNCTSNEKSMIKSFVKALYFLMGAISKKPDNGLWLVSCIQHNVVCNMQIRTKVPHSQVGGTAAN